MRTITKNKVFALLIVSALTLSGYGQTNSEEGFYLNNGKDKIKELNCYAFDDLTVKFPILPEMHGYDFVGIKICKHGYNAKCAESCGIGYDGPVFRAKYKKEDQGELTVFKKGEQANCFDKNGMSRFGLKHTTEDEGLTNASLQVKIIGQMIKGYKEEIVGNRIEKKPMYAKSVTIYEGPILPLVNRVKLTKLKALTIKREVDLSVPCD